ncbi:MAG: hypothetical protein PW735_07265 [Acidobacteriaceae bacterium]|nr:hypothetical protein [Acidobacteriaceae bacterium]
MAELSLAPEPNRSPLKALVIAACVLVLVALAIFFLNPRKVSELTVTQAEVFAPHTRMNSMQLNTGMRVLGTTPEERDDLYIVATVKLENKLRLPIYYSWAEAKLVDPTDAEAQANLITGSDLTNLETSFPNLKPLLPHPLHDGDEAAPGQTLQGQVLFLFPRLNADQWKSRKRATLTLNLAHQDPQTTTIP